MKKLTLLMRFLKRTIRILTANKTSEMALAPAGNAAGLCSMKILLNIVMKKKTKALLMK